MTEALSGDLLIVGAGPAGMAAAITARQAGLTVFVADEGEGPGGQIFRSVLTPAGQSVELGAEYIAGAKLARRFTASGARLLTGAAAFMIEPAAESGFETAVLVRGLAHSIATRAVIIATGALERPFPVPGWTLPGVMTAGAAQTMLKASGVVPVGTLHLVGTGPLLYLLAAQYARLGVPVAALLDTTPPENRGAALAHLPAFLTSRYAWKGLALLREVIGSTRIIRGVRDVSIVGETRADEIHCVVAGGRTLSMRTDTVLLHQGVVPQINLTMACGVPHRWNAQRLAFEPELGAEGQTHRPGLFVAGDTGGIGGASVAQHSGTLAALAILRELDRVPSGTGVQNAAAVRRALRHARRGRAFLDALYRPADAFRVPADDNVIVCRCEEVRAGEIRSLVKRGAPGPNQVKAFSRAGMGPCQGRLCGLTVCEIIAAASGKHPGDIGHMRIRSPVKPVTVGAMSTL